MALRGIQHVVVLIAMEEEAQPLIDTLSPTLEPPAEFPGPSPWRSFPRSLDGLKVTIVTLGKDKETKVDNVGTVPAALATYAALHSHKPDLIINAGTAGGFKSQGAEIGDVFISTHCLNHDRDIPLPGFKEYGVGLKPNVATERLRKELGLKGGVVSTGNSLTTTETTLKMMQEHSAAVKEMEAAGVAWVAELFGVPLFCVKSITDIIDGQRATEEEFMEHIAMACQRLQRVMVDVLRFVNGKDAQSL